MTIRKLRAQVLQFISDNLPCKIYWPHWLLRKGTMRNYKKFHGYKFDLDNPKTFTEKISGILPSMIVLKSVNLLIKCFLSPL